jgi:geranylgeranyl reductase family protein
VNEFDVIVVGGGPAGSAAATFCAQRGLRVALFEHKKFPRHKVCGDLINPNCWPVLERLGAAEKIRALPRHDITGAVFTTPRGAVAEVKMNARAIRRSLFDLALLDHAKACGVTVFEGESAVNITATREVLTRERRYVALRCIIGADGRHSMVAKKTGLARDVTGRNGPIAFQAHFRAPATMDDRVQLHLFPGGYCGVVRVDAERVNLCIVTNREGARWHDDCEKLFARTVCQNPQFRSIGIVPEPLEPLQSAHPLRAAMNCPARDGVLLVGDALSVTEPFTGQGIFFALRTGELAARAICTGEDFASAVKSLYRARGRTNELLRRLMYRPRMAAAVIGALRRWPAAVRWLARNVTGD